MYANTKLGGMVATFILTWNPNNFQWPHRERVSAVRRTAAGHRVRSKWSTGVRKSGISVGDRAFLFRQVADRGIIASGWFTSEIYEGTHWSVPGKVAHGARVDWDVVLDDNDVLPVSDIMANTANLNWSSIRASGVTLPPPDDDVLEQLWVEHINYKSPDELAVELTEGATTRVLVNRYERNPEARRRCIEHHGTACKVCEVDFSSRYGPIGVGFIHVHHLRALSSIGVSHSVDPVKDLRPVCPNCHAMLHTRTPPYTIRELRAMMRS